jgi:hypothetical protein
MTESMASVTAFSRQAFDVDQSYAASFSSPTSLLRGIHICCVFMYLSTKHAFSLS